jgi:maltooligosyltrehalose trehalohydrolase
VRLQREEDGYFSGFVKEAEPGFLYRFKLPGGAFPDPASRFQPNGPHGPSQIIDPAHFRWTDQAWRGVPANRHVIYELHVGTFTQKGTWRSARKHLTELKELGITVLELMPVADFPGRFGWGYDGVNMFAPTRLYGRPEDFRGFVNQAHALGMGVILDVVYNHFGPDGNYLSQFSDDYLTDRYQNEWGEPLNFDGENSTAVRDFVLTNAIYWIEEFHLDGLRLDATQQIFDASPNHILAALSRKVRQAAGERPVYLVAENEPQHIRLVRPFEEGGYGLDALWNDDFHHSAKVALLGRNEAYYQDYRGTPQELVSACKRGSLYQGQWYSWQRKPRGTPAFGIAPQRFVNFIENHDQVANSMAGKRIHQLASPGRFRAMTALLLLGPATPLLFQGQEFGASTPFTWFADHNSRLGELVAAGRKKFLCQFPSLASTEVTPWLPHPSTEQTFSNCKLNAQERKSHGSFYALHRDLLRLRREDPVFSSPQPGGVDGAILGPEAFVLRFFGGDRQDRLLLVNLGLDLNMSLIAEPLLAPPENRNWVVKWSSESPAYGGCGSPGLGKPGQWRLQGHAAVVYS